MASGVDQIHECREDAKARSSALGTLWASWHGAQDFSLTGVMYHHKSPRCHRWIVACDPQRKQRVDVVLRLEVGLEEPHREALPTFLAVYLPSAPLLSVEIIHPRLVGGVQTGVDTSHEKDHRLRLFSIDLEAHATEEVTEGVEGPLEGVGLRATIRPSSA